MQIPNAIKENLRFLILEVSNQLGRTSSYILSQDSNDAVSVIDKHDYVINLTTVVQNNCFSGLSGDSRKKEQQLAIRCLYNLASALNRIAILSVNTVIKFHECPSECLKSSTKTQMLFRQCIKILDRLEDVMLLNTKDIGLVICDQSEELISEITQYSAELNKRWGESDSSQVILYLPFALEQIASELVLIGEAVISLENRQILTVRQMRALNQSLPAVAGARRVENSTLTFEKVGETKSGCSITGISEVDSTDVDLVEKEGAQSNDYLAIFKEGKKSKLKNEKKQFETWNNIFPGMAPKVISYKKQGKSAALLVEYIKGKTFEQVLLSGNRNALEIAVRDICNTMRSVWLRTLSEEEAVSASFMEQLAKRFGSIARVHPEYDHVPVEFGGLHIASLRELIDRSVEKEIQIPPPFAVFAHGDFNIDNVIFGSEDGNPRFIDLHRSKFTDYLQDVSVFMVSNYRIQVVDRDIRRNISYVLSTIFDFVREFAAEKNDNTMQARLGYGLARSFITSTRFILDDDFSNDMFFRGRYLLEKLDASSSKELNDFQLPQDVFHG